MLAAGAPLSEVIASFCGACSAGRAATALWLQFLMMIPTLHSRRKVLEHFLRTFNGARLHGAQWRVVDAAGFVGAQHERVPLELERIDPTTGEYTCERPKGYRSDPEHRHKRAPRGFGAGGLADLSKRSPRQLNRYRATLRAGRIIASRQPPYDATDAVRPRRSDGTWAYAQHWLVLPPTPEMLARWRGRTAPPVHDYRALSARPWSAAQAPRVGDLAELAQLAER